MRQLYFSANAESGYSSRALSRNGMSQKRQERADGVSERDIYALSAEMGTERRVNRMSDRRLIAVELTDKHMDILCRSIDIKKEYLDAEENVADAIVMLIEQVGEMI